MTKQIRIVLDTNILISSLWGGKPSKIIEMWDKGKILVVVSQGILDEYFEVLNRFDLTDEDIEEITILFANPNKTLVIEPKSKLKLIKKDPEDNKFLECALEGGVEYIVSGDIHLLEQRCFRNIKIVSVSKFLEENG